jgi:hypothetical protein
MEANTLDQTLDGMRQYIERQVAAGFLSDDEIREQAVEIHADYQSPDTLLPYARRFVEEAAAAHLIEQAGWEDVTDCDRLAEAFADLEAQGIVSRQNFSCCGTCGADEIEDEMQAARSQGRKVRGYTFFHMQDTEHAAAGTGLYLSFGSSSGKLLSETLTGFKVSRTIRRHGLKTKWNGSLFTRILVEMDWQRRR